MSNKVMQGLSVSIQLPRKRVEMLLTPLDCNQQLGQLIISERLSHQQATILKQTIVRDVRIMYDEYQRQLHRNKVKEVNNMSLRSQQQVHTHIYTHPQSHHDPGQPYPHHNSCPSMRVESKGQSLGREESESEEPYVQPPIKYQQKHSESTLHDTIHHTTSMRKTDRHLQHTTIPHKLTQFTQHVNPENSSGKKCVLLKNLMINTCHPKVTVAKVSTEPSSISKGKKVGDPAVFKRLYTHKKTYKREESEASVATKPISKSHSKSPPKQFEFETSKRAEKGETFCMSRKIQNDMESEEQKQRLRDKGICHRVKRRKQEHKATSQERCEMHKCEVWKNKVDPEPEKEYPFRPNINRLQMPSPVKAKPRSHPLNSNLEQLYQQFERDVVRL